MRILALEVVIIFLRFTFFAITPDNVPIAVFVIDDKHGFIAMRIQFHAVDIVTHRFCLAFAGPACCVIKLRSIRPQWITPANDYAGVVTRRNLEIIVCTNTNGFKGKAVGCGYCGGWHQRITKGRDTTKSDDTFEHITP